MIRGLLHFSNSSDSTFLSKLLEGADDEDEEHSEDGDHSSSNSGISAPLLFICLLNLGGHEDRNVRLQSLDLLMRMGRTLGMSLPHQQKAKRLGLQVTASNEAVYRQAAMAVSEVFARNLSRLVHPFLEESMIRYLFKPLVDAFPS